MQAATTAPAEAYFIIDDCITESGREGFIVCHGNPQTAIGTRQFEAFRLGDCKRWLASRLAEGEPVFRVRLARRHGAHTVKRLPMP